VLGELRRPHDTLGLQTLGIRPVVIPGFGLPAGEAFCQHGEDLVFRREALPIAQLTRRVRERHSSDFRRELLEPRAQATDEPGPVDAAPASPSPSGGALRRASAEW